MGKIRFERADDDEWYVEDADEDLGSIHRRVATRYYEGVRRGLTVDRTVPPEFYFEPAGDRDGYIELEDCRNVNEAKRAVRELFAD